MFSKSFTMAALGAALAITPTTRVAADADGLVGGIVGGIVGGAIVNHANKNRQQKRTVVVRQRSSSSAYSAARAERRQIQASLNYFGFNAGVEDGIMGGQTRAAVSRYQGYLGTPTTGQITEYEKNILMGSYHRSVAGGPDVARIISKHRDRVKGVLIAQRDGEVGRMSGGTGYAGMPMVVSDAVDEIAESSDPSAEQLLQRSGFVQLADLNGDGNTDYILDTAFSGSSFWCNASQCKTLVFASTADGYRRNDLLLQNPQPASFECSGGICRVASEAPAPQPVAQQPESGTQMVSASASEAAPAPAVPVFNTVARRSSLGTFCSKMNVVINANGGYTTVSDMQDPEATLGEQLCLVRTYAIAGGEELIASVSGATPEQIAQQCDGLGEAMKAKVDAVALSPASEVLAKVNGFISGSGMSPEQLETTARICMSSGYQTENMRTTLSGALLMVALGQAAYAELVGHHLVTGYGTVKRPKRAGEWYDMAVTALEQGATPVVARADQPDRPALLRAAVNRMNGGGAQQGAAVPVFTVAE